MPTKHSIKVEKDTRPTHLLKYKEKRSGSKRRWHRVGAGWLNENNVITIQLERGIVLDWRDEKEWLLAMVENDEVNDKKKTRKKKAK